MKKKKIKSNISFISYGQEIYTSLLSLLLKEYVAKI